MSHAQLLKHGGGCWRLYALLAAIIARGREQVGVPGKVPPGLPATAQLLSECAGILEEFVLLSAAESSS